MKNIKFAFIALVALTPLTGCANINRNATVKVRVVDENGQPIKGVLSEVMSMSMDDSNSKKGFSDIDGMYSVHLRNIHLNIGGFFNKPDYYETKGKFWSWGLGQGYVPPAETNFVVVLKRIIEPIPMKERELLAIFPRLDEPFGYDLVIGDWVAPDGKGENTDMLLTAEKQYVAEDDFTVKLFVEFTGEHNGIQSFHYSSKKVDYLLRSELPPPPIAPLSGYIQTHEITTRRIPNPKWFEVKSTHDKERMWIFRIRTEVDDDGKIVAANYGWFTRDFGIGNIPDGTARTGFKFYYNPDPHSRSLEPKEIAERQAKDLPRGED